MKRKVILAGGKIQDGSGSLDHIDNIERKIISYGRKVVTLTIDSLAAGWRTPIAPHHFRSGASPVDALEYAGLLIDSKDADYVVISGRDYLRTGYTKEERKKLMDIYPGEFSIPEGYTRLAFSWMEINGFSRADFQEMADFLLANYRKTAVNEGLDLKIDEKWYEPVTGLFRGVDCANPYVDFTARLIVGDEDSLKNDDFEDATPVFVLATSVCQVAGDGKNYIAEIARFDHMKRAYKKACDEAGIDFRQKFLAGKAGLEVYTCYPVVPLAFLLNNKIAGCKDDLASLLEKYDVTQTGGMNFGKAAWNNPSLNALLAMREKVAAGKYELGLVHANGGVGYKQAVAILSKTNK